MEIKEVITVKEYSQQNFAERIMIVSDEQEELNRVVSIDFKPLLDSKDKVVYTALIISRG